MDLWSKFKLAKQFIGSFSGFLVPVAVIVLFFVLSRLALPFVKHSKKGSAPGGKDVSTEDLQAFQETVERFEEELGFSKTSVESLMSSERDQDESVKKVVREADQDFQLGIIQLAGALEKEVGVLAAASARKHGKRLTNAHGPMKFLVEKKHLPDTLVKAMELFSRLSDRIVRGKVPEHSPAARQTFATGLGLLSTIRRAHGVTHEIERTGVDVYSDEGCTNAMPDVKGVIVRKMSPENEHMSKRIFPTANPAYYEIGKRVTWEWNMENLLGRAFYVDPDTGEKKVAWDSSAEFRGRLIDES